MNRILSLKARISEKPSIAIYIVSLLIAVISLCLIHLFHVKTELLCFSHSLVTGLFGQYLAALGMLTAVSVAVMSWIYNQGINSRQKGFSDFRIATSKLTMNVVEMLQNLQRATKSNQILLFNWASATQDLIRRLNEITPGWKGWEQSQDIEKALENTLVMRDSALKNTGNFLSTDLVWMKIFANDDAYSREIIIGLYWLSLGSMATKTSKMLYQFFLSIIILLILGVIATIGEIVRANNTNYVDSVFMLVFTLLVIGHVVWLAHIIVSWWQKQRSQEKHWESQ